MSTNPISFRPIDGLMPANAAASPTPSTYSELHGFCLKVNHSYQVQGETIACLKSKVTQYDQLTFSARKIDSLTQETLLEFTAKVKLKMGSSYVDFPRNISNIDSLAQELMKLTHFTFGGLIDPTRHDGNLALSFKKERASLPGHVFIKTIIADDVEELLDRRPISTTPFFDLMDFIIEELASQGIKRQEIDKFHLIIIEPTCEMIEARLETIRETFHSKDIANQIDLEREAEILDAIARIKNRIIDQKYAATDQALNEIFARIHAVCPQVNKIIIKTRV